MSKIKIRFFGYGMLLSVILVFLYMTLLGNDNQVDDKKAEEVLNKQGYKVIKSEEFRLLEEKTAGLEIENKALQEKLAGKNENAPEQTEVEILTFNIQPGMSLEEIGNSLDNINIIDSSSEFVQFMIENKYDRNIQIGEFDLNKGMSYEEIAEIISK